MLRRSLLLIGLVVISGCNITDPYARDGVWRPNGANDANLRAMVVSPSDLTRGVSARAAEGQQAEAALDRYRKDKIRRLPDSGIAKVTPVSNSGGSQGESQ